MQAKNALFILANFFNFCYVINMTATYKLNTKELEPNFIDIIRNTYPNQVVEIEVRELPTNQEQDTTEYLLSTHANREHLMKARKNVEDGKIISFNTIEEAVKRAEELSAQ
jgi:PHD/YefM family antitoxin component YafN of YafNO toxin-antitoxin module